MYYKIKSFMGVFISCSFGLTSALASFMPDSNAWLRLTVGILTGTVLGLLQAFR